jgi:hypothetical protein
VDDGSVGGAGSGGGGGCMVEVVMTLMQCLLLLVLGAAHALEVHVSLGPLAPKRLELVRTCHHHALDAKCHRRSDHIRPIVPVMQCNRSSESSAVVSLDHTCVQFSALAMYAASANNHARLQWERAVTLSMQHVTSTEA